MAKVIVDKMRCEGKKTCAQICPEAVFEMAPVETSLPVLVLVKVYVHGGKQAIVRNEAACTACMKCVDACPEQAIRVIAA